MGVSKAETRDRLDQGNGDISLRYEKALAMAFVPSESEIASIYDQIADEFFRHRHDETTDFDIVGWPWMRTILNGRVNDRDVLDVACGTGVVAHKMFHDFHPKSVTGIDISGEMLQIAKREVRDKRSRFLLQSASHLQFPADSFDLVVSTYGMDYVLDLPSALREISRVLRPSGSFVFLIPHPARNQLYYEGGGGVGPVPEGWYLETWRGAGGVQIPKHYLKLGSWIRELDLAGLALKRMYEPHPLEAAMESAPEIYQRYLRSPRTVIFDVESMKPQAFVPSS